MHMPYQKEKYQFCFTIIFEWRLAINTHLGTTQMINLYSSYILVRNNQQSYSLEIIFCPKH